MRTSCAWGGATSTSSMVSSLPASHATAALQVMVFSRPRQPLPFFASACSEGLLGAMPASGGHALCSPFPPCRPLRRYAGSSSGVQGFRSWTATAGTRRCGLVSLRKTACGGGGDVNCDGPRSLVPYLYDAELPSGPQPHLETAQSEVGFLSDGDRHAGNCRVRCRCWAPASPSALLGLSLPWLGAPAGINGAGRRVSAISRNLWAGEAGCESVGGMY